MAMVSLSMFTPFIAFRVLGCPDPAIERCVLDACIEFCERSTTLRVTLDPVTINADDSQIQLDDTATTRIVRVVRAWIDGTEILPTSEQDADHPLGYVDSVSGVSAYTGRPRTFVDDGPGLIRLWPRPDKQYQLTARCVVKPSRSATQVDSQLFDDHADAVVDGALARLFEVPGPWFDARMSKMHRDRFDEACNNGRVMSTIGATSAELRIAPVRI